MKIAYLSTFYPFRGGIAQFNASLFQALKKENEMKAFNFKRQYPDLLFPGSSQYVTADDKVEKIENDRLLDTINPFTYFSTAKAIKEFGAEVCITKFWMPFFAPSLGTVLKSIRKTGTKNITILDNVIPHEKRIGDMQLIDYFLDKNDFFVAMSQNVKNDLLSIKPDAKFQVLTHPLYDHFGEKMEKVEARNQLNLPLNKKLLLFFGFIRDYKGLDLLIDAMTYLDEEYELIIAGEVYGSFDKYKKQIRDLNLDSRIHHFVRYISDDEVPALFSATDVCVLPYYSATQSGIVGISHHFDVPLVATNVGGLKEIIADTGIISEEVSPHSIALAIEESYKSKYDFQTAIQNFKKNLSWKNFGNKLLDFNAYKSE